jgi:hypothetical protein
MYSCPYKVLAETGKKAFDIVLAKINLNHPGTCYRNSKHGPAVAKEYAMERAGEIFLDTDDDDEAIFGDEIVCDGDTRGPMRFIAKQIEIIGKAAAKLATIIPDLGHFLKNTSNGMYSKKHLLGVRLLTKH